MHTLHQCRRIAPSGCSQAAILLPGALDALAQAELYGELCRTTRFTDQWRHLLSDGESPMTARPEPFCVRRWSRSADLAFVSSLLPFLSALFDDPEVGGSKRAPQVFQHPHSGQTNALEKPELVFATARSLAERAADELRDDATALGLRELCFDSLVSLLYPAGGALDPHVDRGLPGLGLSLSLGAACSFEYGGTVTVLRSGDALFGAFGAVTHQVLRVHDATTAPDWWRRLPAGQGDDDNMVTFGRARCSLQIRDSREMRARRARGRPRRAAAQR